jgi:hypothetical protein
VVEGPPISAVFSSSVVDPSAKAGSSAVSSGKAAEGNDFAAEWFFGGVKTFDVSEKAVMPPREILR